MLPHVRVHVGEIEVQAPVVLEVEDLDSHGSPRRGGKQLPALLHESPAFDVLEVLVVALHVGQIQVGPSVVVGIERTGVPRPTRILQTRLLRDVDEPVSALVPIEDAGLRERGIQVAVEGVRRGTVVGIGSVIGSRKGVMDDRPDFVRSYRCPHSPGRGPAGRRGRSRRKPPPRNGPCTRGPTRR